MGHDSTKRATSKLTPRFDVQFDGCVLDQHNKGWLARTLPGRITRPKIRGRS